MERDQVTKILASNIKRLMEERGVKAPRVAEDAGLNRTAVYDIIKERSMSPKVSTVASISEALNVPLSDLFLTPEQLEARATILRKWETLPDEGRKRLHQVADAFLLESTEEL